MSEIDWDKARPLLERALDLDPAQVEAFLGIECGEDHELREQLVDLVRREREESKFLLNPDHGSPMQQEEASADQLVGPFRLVRRIGDGGMGSVWLAEREGDFRQKVAIKILRKDRLGEEHERRFRRERSLLARLQHPSIARLIDGGALADGVSYLAMEFVDGVEIDRWVRERKLDVPAILQLFVRVCGAVQAAHEAGVVHRDIKPSNLLITTEGTPKLLDFGIAKLIEHQESDTLLVTQTGLRLLTPRYASPEQVRGEEITPSTDVFCMGVLLFELLTDRLPHGQETTTWRDLQDAILNEPARRPSTLVERGRRTQLRGDLDIVLLRALAKEPSRRYSSAGALADDLRRYMDGRPVLARPDSKIYRASKFLGRNVAFVTATAAVIVSLSIGLAASHYNFVQAEDARERTAIALTEASLRSDIADAVNAFLTDDLLRGADPTQSHDVDVSMRTVLDQAAERIEGRFPEAPLVEAAVQYALAGTYLGLGLGAEAEPHCRRAYELCSLHAGPEAVETLEAGRDLAMALGLMGERDAEIALEEELIERMSPVFGRDDGYVMVLISNLASAYSVVGRHEEAVKMHREMLGIRERAFGDLHENTLKSLNNLGTTLARIGRDDEAAPYIQKAADLRAQLLGEDHPATLLSRGNLAAILARTGRLEEAYSNGRAVYEGQVRVQGMTHPITIKTAINLGVVAALLEDFNEAQRWARIGWDALVVREEWDSPDALKAARIVVASLEKLERWQDTEAFLFEVLDQLAGASQMEEFELLLDRVYEQWTPEEDA